MSCAPGEACVASTRCHRALTILLHRSVGPVIGLTQPLQHLIDQQTNIAEFRDPEARVVPAGDPSRMRR